MTVSFKGEGQRRLFQAVLSELRSLQYSGDLLEEGYAFGDWFLEDIPEREVAAAAFGQLPVSYDTACFAVALADRNSGVALVREFRALGAPILFEVDNDSVSQWKVGSSDKTTELQDRFGFNEIAARFAQFADEWAPQKLLRSKNVATERWEFQHSLFAGLIPDLEERIQEVLGPMLRSAIALASKTFRRTAKQQPDERDLFRLAFWMLAGKVFHDRNHEQFADLTIESGPDEVLLRVSRHYSEPMPVLLNDEAKSAIFRRLWSPRMDFRNLSVEILSIIWATSLVTEKLREQLGIHRTPRSIVRYIVEHLNFSKIPQEECRVVEPCCGSGAFLLGALGQLRDVFRLPEDPKDRHAFFANRLFGFERDSFGVEITKLCLTLADYPNPNGWKIRESNIFTDQNFTDILPIARVLLCNPPFEPFNKEDRDEFKTIAVQKPAELLRIVLDRLHPLGVLGIVLPRAFIDGQGYRTIRRRLVERFADIQIVTLPDRAWDIAGRDTILLMAVSPKGVSSSPCIVRHCKVREDGWRDFDLYHKMSAIDTVEKSADAAEESLTVPDLLRVWEYLEGSQTLGDKTVIHRGIEWNKRLTTPKREETGWRKVLVQDSEFTNSKLGVPPLADLYCFQFPDLKHLDFSDQYRRGNSHLNDWAAQKVIMNSVRKSRGAWRIAAFVDTIGVACYQNCTAVWANNQSDLSLVAAILNSPIANAYLSSRQGNIHLTIKDIERIPVPRFTDALRDKIDELVAEYVGLMKARDELVLASDDNKLAEDVLRQIDATILDAYDLPPRLERELLDYFSGEERKTPYIFHEYFPHDFEPCFKLSEWLTGRPKMATVERFRSQSRDVPSHILEAMRDEHYSDYGEDE